jgi:ABC-2 type transport system ATP-binding protein
VAVIEAAGLTHRYGRVNALSDVDLSIPQGSVYALVGPNGAGKTTLMQILLGLRRPTAGRVAMFGKPIGELTCGDRAAIGHVADGQRLPRWMTLAQLEAYVAPLYPTWDAVLAADLRRRFRLDPTRRIGTLSKGEHMKAALLCSLASRPRLLLLDEPFSGLDALVKDELVRGVLESAAGEDWTVLVCSHDLGELELLADHVGFLDDGRLLFSGPMEVLRERYAHVEIVTAGASPLAVDHWPEGWLGVERSGRRVALLVCGADQATEPFIRRHIPDASRIERRPATLREVFVALARRGSAGEAGREAAE